MMTRYEGDEEMTDDNVKVWFNQVEDQIKELVGPEVQITTRRVLNVGVVAQTALEKTGKTDSEDFSDLFYAISNLLEWAAAKMLWNIYKDDEGIQESMFSWSEEEVDNLKWSLHTVNQFGMLGLLEKDA